jgi:hypothetical protein
VLEEYRKVEDRGKPLECDCGGLAEKIISAFVADRWGPKTLYHIDHYPRTFKTRKELRRYCDKKGVESGALL